MGSKKSKGTKNKRVGKDVPRRKAGRKVPPADPVERPDPGPVALDALREAVAETRHHLARLGHLNRLRQALREAIARARRHRATMGPPWDRDEGISPFPTTLFDLAPGFDEGGQATVRTREDEPARTRLALEAYVDRLEGELRTAGEEAQIVGVALAAAVARERRAASMAVCLARG